jgi:hypothetical protein
MEILSSGYWQRNGYEPANDKVYILRQQILKIFIPSEFHTKVYKI